MLRFHGHLVQVNAGNFTKNSQIVIAPYRSCFCHLPAVGGRCCVGFTAARCAAVGTDDWSEPTARLDASRAWKIAL